VKVPTTRFGVLEIEEEQIIHMRSGILGFPEAQRYMLLEHKKGSPYIWFQSVDHESLAFVLMDPLLFKPDYEVRINPEDSRELELKETPGGIQTFVVINISRGNSSQITANLLGPIVINVQKKKAKQIVLDPNHYSTRYPIPTR
jgi:flagellar assembly factor FliW